MVRIAAGLAFLLLATAAHADRRLVGEARDPESDALIYREEHLLRETQDVPRERLVLYRCPNGELFARKRVSYGDTPTTPTFALEDGRFGYREGLRRDGERLTAYVKRDQERPETQGEIAAAESLVVDAGFDEFVRARWDALQRGDGLPISFLVPSRQRTYTFRLKRLGAEQIEGAAATRLRLSLGGVLGWFLPHIDVSYRDRDRRLMRFEGLTNIRIDPEDTYVARIEFPPRLESTLTPEAWDAALAEPITACQPGG